MHPSKILTLLALGISSFSHLAQASGGDSKQKNGNMPGKIRKTILDEDSDKYAVIPDMIARDPTQVDMTDKAISESVKLSQSEIEQEEAEIQAKSENLMSKIMNRYRQDMGIVPVLKTNAQNASVDEVIMFLDCFQDRPHNIQTDSSNFDEIVKAYSFFKYIGKIPLNTKFPDQCQEIKESVELRSFEDILRVYRELNSAFTIINWDLLKLMPFKNQYFPVTEFIIKPFTFNYEIHGKPDLIREFTTQPSLTVYGKKVLKTVFDKIRFLNPKTEKGRIILLYQRIYRRYSKDLGIHANPYYIDWGYCTVHNWPMNMDRCRVSKWTDEDIREMNALIDSDLLKFEYSSQSLEISGQCKFLGKSRTFGPDDYIDIKAIKGTLKEKNTTVSDDEDFGGEERARFLKRIKEARRSNDNKRDSIKKKSKITRKYFEEFYGASEEDEKKRRKKQRFESKEGATKKRPEFESDEEAEFDDNFIKNQIITKPKSSKQAKSSVPKSSKKLKTEESEDGVKIIMVKDNSSTPASPEARQKMFKKMLELFRKKTGQRHATEIDWSLSKVHCLQNHLLPFSTNFETVGDIKTLNNLIKSRTFKFLNLSNLADRKIRAYERLYAIYAKATGKYRNEYDIEWDDVEFTGLPDNIDENFFNWNQRTVAEIESQLDKNAITFEFSEDMKEEIAKVEADLQAKMAKSGDVELPDSPVSTTSHSNSLRSSDIEIERSDESTSTTSLLGEDVSIEGQNQRKSMGIGKLVIIPNNSNKEGQYMTPHFMASVLKGKSLPGPKRLLNTADNDDKNTSSHAEVEQVSLKNDYVPRGYWVTISNDEPAEVNRNSSSTITSTIDDNRIISYGEFSGNTVEQVLAHQNSVQESISNYLQARESFSERSRHRRLINYIIECLELILENVKNFESPQPPRMVLDEVHEYLNIFLDALAGLGSANEIENFNKWKTLVISTVKFRARLAGATAKYDRHKYVVTIPESMIANRMLFGFLTGPENKWDLDILDQFVDGSEDVPIFNNS